MKKYLTIAAAVASTVAFTTAASAALSGFEIGVGISHLNFGGESKTDATPAVKSDTKKAVLTADLGVGYAFGFGKWSVTPYAFIQSGGGKLQLVDNDDTIKRKFAWGLALRAGFDVAPRSSVYIKLGAKQGQFDYKNTNGAGTSTKKTEKPWGLLGGVGFKLDVSEKVALDLGYTYVNYGTIKSKKFAGATTHLETKMTDNDVRLGVSYKF